MKLQRHRIATIVCLFGLWLQMMAPAFALSMQNHALDPLSVICHSGSASDQDHRKAPAHHTPACEHCLLCHAVSGGLVPDVKPVFTHLDYPVSSPHRWATTEALAPPTDIWRHAEPRGPPTLV